MERSMLTTMGHGNNADLCQKKKTAADYTSKGDSRGGHVTARVQTQSPSYWIHMLSHLRADHECRFEQLLLHYWPILGGWCLCDLQGGSERMARVNLLHHMSKMRGFPKVGCCMGQ